MILGSIIPPLYICIEPNDYGPNDYEGEEHMAADPLEESRRELDDLEIYETTQWEEYGFDPWFDPEPGDGYGEHPRLESGRRWDHRLLREISPEYVPVPPEPRDPDCTGSKDSDGEESDRQFMGMDMEDFLRKITCNPTAPRGEKSKGFALEAHSAEDLLELRKVIFYCLEHGRDLSFTITVEDEGRYLTLPFLEIYKGRIITVIAGYSENFRLFYPAGIEPYLADAPPTSRFLRSMIDEESFTSDPGEDALRFLGEPSPTPAPEEGNTGKEGKQREVGKEGKEGESRKGTEMKGLHITLAPISTANEASDSLSAKLFDPLLPIFTNFDSSLVRGIIDGNVSPEDIARSFPLETFIPYMQELGCRTGSKEFGMLILGILAFLEDLIDRTTNPSHRNLFRNIRRQIGKLLMGGTL